MGKDIGVTVPKGAEPAAYVARAKKKGKVANTPEKIVKNII